MSTIHWPKEFINDQNSLSIDFQKKIEGSALKKKINFIWQKILSIIKSIVLRTAFMPSTFRRERKKEGSIEITTYDGCKLTGYIFEPLEPETNLFDFSKKKWMIYFHGNNAIAEDQEIAKWLSASFKVNVLSFNYRGTGSSQGSLINPENDLCVDGVAAIQYLKEEGYLENSDITLYGHSMGGMVATKSAAYFPGCRIINDRSFWNSAKVVPRAEKIVRKLGIEVDVLSSWEKIPTNKKLIVYCNQDGVIRKEASLYKRCKKDGQSAIKLIKKGSNGFEKHGRPFNWFDNGEKTYQPLYNFIHDVIIL